MTVETKQDAWNKANDIMTYDFEYHTELSQRAGYPIYFTTKSNCAEWIADLNDRLECNLANGETVNIWVRPTLEQILHRDGFHKNSLGLWVQ